ncbi:MAG: CDP-diacylglycerol--glycerol-3-phosphate 3-phosphatidyltransferase [Candidatus Omnitrophica bacterium]|nr:CDP-diacylglycerol--glycerol-3-phosphate 3-phosphatidyltransferase [Candidatus Omnitrophota bacterium]MDD5352825.1 CDP-diacylglycerol--glycerol-3-phosphate 3-phosphatidyltransferase [Candidatus Omnitrophota bacterium]MDD5550424.1 CDP-diacylglycerol--glycerol-3-phosphate 3-phosphatidyltransferase [Candidatus Omnitrophota bacterium]
MNISNKLTILRLLLAFVFMAFLFIEGLNFKIIAFLIFSFACFTDFLDGWLARRRNEITDLGKLMDPIADKVLVLSAFLSFVEMHLIWAWMVVIIIIREMLITGLRILAITKGKVLEAGISGKHKTVSQMLTIFFILIVLIVREIGVKQNFWTPAVENTVNYGIIILMFITLSLTVSSGFSYLWRNRQIIISL